MSNKKASAVAELANYGSKASKSGSIHDPIVDAFAHAHGLTRLIEVGCELAASCFDLAEPTAINLVNDPEADREWIELRVRARGGAAAVHDAYDQYTQKWLAAVPVDKATEIRLAIRLE